MGKINFNKLGETLVKLGESIKSDELTKEEKENTHKFAAETRLEDGETVIATPADEFREGVEIFVMTDGEALPLPVGEYVLQDGSMVTVETEGIVSTYTPASSEENEGEAPANPQPEMEQEAAPKPKSVVESQTVSKELKFDKEDKEKIEALETKLSEVEKNYNELKEQSNTQLAQLIEGFGEISKVVKELSEPVAEEHNFKAEGKKKRKKEKPVFEELSAEQIAALSYEKRMAYIRAKYNFKQA